MINNIKPELISNQIGPTPMNALRYIARMGIVTARDVVGRAPENAAIYDSEKNTFITIEDSSIAMAFMDRFIDLSELKRFVNSVGIIETRKGIAFAKAELFLMGLEFDHETEQERELKRAIADYEAIEETVLEGAISLNTKGKVDV